MIVKVCGVTSRHDAELALRAGADNFGMICNIPQSPRNCSADRIEEIAAGLNESLIVLTADEDARTLIDLARRLNPAGMQLHGQEEFETVAELRSAWDGEIWKAIHVPVGGGEKTPVDELVEDMAGYAEAGADCFVVDTVDASGGQRKIGGTGKTGDWSAIRQIVEYSGLYIILAGGLGPGNVAEAVAAVKPAGVDVSSGVEASKGVKDPEKVRLFVENARRAGAAAAK